jgi:altered-inheritance-of-mitochondria protein 5
MGKVHGFLGALLVTTTVTYFTSKEFKDNQEHISRTIKRTQDIIDGLEHSTGSSPREMVFTHRPSMRETIADLWDDSVLSGIQWVYAIDTEKSISSLLQKISDLSK